MFPVKVGVATTPKAAFTVSAEYAVPPTVRAVAAPVALKVRLVREGVTLNPFAIVLAE